MSDKPEDAVSGEDVVGTGNDARVALLNSIGDSNDVLRADELANVNDDDTTEPFEPTPRTPVDAVDAVPADDEPSAPPPVEEPAVQKITRKVNGKDVEHTLDEWLAIASKVAAADQYLADAKRTTQSPAEPVKPRGPTPEELQRQQDEEDRALVRAIQMGTEEEAAAALRKLRTQTTSARPSISQDDVSRTIDERLAFNEAIKAFRTEYSDIVNDPYLNKLALDRDAELLAQGDTRPYAERYSEIGLQLRSWKDTLVKAPQADAAKVVTTAEKIDRKAAAPKVPVVASAKTKPPVVEDEDDETPHDVIANMAKSRGGPQWMRG